MWEVIADKQSGEDGEPGWRGRDELCRGSDMPVQLRQRRGGEGRSRLNSSALHERQQLVGDLGEDIFSQPGHAEDLVARSVDVVSERNKLEAMQTKNECKLS